MPGRSCTPNMPPKPAAAAAAPGSGRRRRHRLVDDLALHVDDLALGRRLHDRLRCWKLDLELAARLDTIRDGHLHRLARRRIHNPHGLSRSNSRRAGHDHGRRHRLGMHHSRGDGLVVGRRLRLDDLGYRRCLLIAEHLAHDCFFFWVAAAASG